jgi:transcriptional regulator of heat shock response
MVRFTVSYTNNTGTITTKHETTRSALEEAREYIRKGYHDVTLTDLGTGEKHEATEIKKKLEHVDGLDRDT